MEEKRFKISESVVLVAAILIIVGAAFVRPRPVAEETYRISRLRCAIELGRMDDTTAGLLTGYNYHLIERFAADNDIDLTISLSRRGDNFVDSLKRGIIDMVVVPYGDEEFIDSVETSIPVDSISVWLLPEGSGKTKALIDGWIKDYHHSDVYEPTRNTFLKTYDPIRAARAGRRQSYLSPYDTIVKRYADTLGWDWKLLSAVIYQESKFKIDARSHRGAIGLMQMMPFTADKWSDGDIINPENSIRAGTLYLKNLQKRFRKVSSIDLERQKFVLAAYNAGEGRMQDVINYASVRNVSTECWDSLAVVIPEMRDSLTLALTDTIKLGIFKGIETLSYVDRVISLYEAFNRIYQNPADERR